MQFPFVLTISRSQLEGVRHPRTFTELIKRPELRFHGVQSLSVQLLQRATGSQELTAYLALLRISMLLASFSQTISHSQFHSERPTRHSRIVTRQFRANSQYAYFLDGLSSDGMSGLRYQSAIAISLSARKSHLPYGTLLVLEHRYQ